jgi:hypothetical protein
MCRNVRPSSANKLVTHSVVYGGRAEGLSLQTERRIRTAGTGKVTCVSGSSDAYSSKRLKSVPLSTNGYVAITCLKDAHRWSVSAHARTRMNRCAFCSTVPAGLALQRTSHLASPACTSLPSADLSTKDCIRSESVYISACRHRPSAGLQPYLWYPRPSFHNPLGPLGPVREILKHATISCVNN